MKKSLLFLAAFAAAAFISCNKEIAEAPVRGSEETTEQTPGGELSEFSFSVSRELPATKSYLEENDFIWEDGEGIAVCYGSSVVKFTYSASTDKFSSSEFDSSASGPFYVVAPYSEDISIDASGKVKAHIPVLQTAGPKGIDSNAILSVGKAESLEALSEGVSLKNAFSLVKIGITDTDVNRISIDGNYAGTALAPVIAGDVSVDPATGNVAAAGRSTSASLVPAEGNFAAGDYIIAVAPQTMANGIKVVFRRDGEAKSYYRNSSKSITFERNKGIAFAAVSAASLDKRCYFVTDAEDLQAWNVVDSFSSDDNIFLGADIDMDGVSWSPVDGFAGTFDGQNHRVYNISVSGNEYVGFIKNSIDSETDATVLKNVVFGSVDGENWDGVSNFTHASSATDDTWYYVGVIAKAQQSASLQNVVNYAKIEVAEGATGKTRIGGICGNWASKGSMLSCVNYGSVENNASISGKDGDSYVDSVIGGIVGQCDEAGTIQECINYGNVSTVNTYVGWIGGILGNTSSNVALKKCVNYGNITTSGYYNGWAGVGGICGTITGGSVSECDCIDSEITDHSNVCAGIVANMKNTTISDCDLVNCKVTSSGNNYVAGIVARANGGTVSKCRVLDDCIISGAQYVGGLSANAWTKAKFTDCSIEDATIEGTKNVGGAVAWLEGGSLLNNTSLSGTTVTGSSTQVGGFVGYFDSSTIDGGSISDDSSVKGQEEVGGIVGYHVNSGEITNCSIESLSVVSNTDDVGGVIGWTKGGGNLTITDCSVVGSSVQSSTGIAGGIVGLKQQGGIVKISGCTVSSTSVDGGSKQGVGGIVGRATAAEDFYVDNCFFINQSYAKGLHSVGGIIGFISQAANKKITITNCGVEKCVLEATKSDGTPPGGDSMVAGIVGWLSAANSGVVARVLNCYSYPSAKGLVVDTEITTPDVAGLFGFVSPSSSGSMLLSNCVTNVKQSDIIVNGAVTDASAGKRVGAVFACLYNDYATVTISDNCYISDSGLLIGDSKDGSELVNTSVVNNHGYPEATFISGSSVASDLNAYVSAFSGSETLKSWTVDASGLPVLVD